MRSSFGLKGIAAACLLSCFIAGGVAAMTAPGSASGVAAVTINRSNKADRLPQAPAAQQSESNSASSPAETARKVPFGCDPAFSPVAEPARAHVFKRCMA